MTSTLLVFSSKQATHEKVVPRSIPIIDSDMMCVNYVYRNGAQRRKLNGRGVKCSNFYDMYQNLQCLFGGADQILIS